MAAYSFDQLVNLEQVGQLLESHHQLSGMAYGLFDADEHNLVAVGWQDICARFHRVNPITCARCRESDAFIKAHLHEAGETFLEYRCKNGMIDIALPILIGGEHLATFFTGQFFYEDDPPDRSFFQAQAGAVGFELESYLCALDRTPRFSHDHIRQNVLFLHDMVQLLAETGLKNLEAAREMEERKKAEASLSRLNRELRALSDCNQSLIRAVDEQTLLDDVCRIICDEAGYRLAWVGFAEHDEEKTVRPVAWAGLDSGYLVNAELTWAEDQERGMGPAGSAIRSGNIVYVQNFATDPRVSIWREQALLRGFRSSIALPLKDEQQQVFGVLQIYAGEADAMTPEEIRLLEELSGDLAFGIVALRARLERKRMEESLAIREREFRTLAENAPDVIVRYDRECRRIYVNPAFERVNHLTSQQVLGKSPVELSGELTPMAVTFTERLKEVLETGLATQIDLVWSKDGRENCWFVRAIPEFAPGGEVAGALTIWTDITERKRLETALRGSEQKFRSLAENSSDNIFRYDRQCRITYANHQVKKTLLTEESFLGSTPLERFPNGLFEGGRAEMENYQAALQRVIASGDVDDVELHVTDASGNTHLHSVRFTAERDQDGQILGALAFGRDITEKHKLEEQLRQSQKMEAVGQLAGGVAHDFNNILTAILGFSNLVKMKMKPEDPQQQLIDQIVASSNRAAQLTRSLLAFSRKQVLVPKPVDLNAIVANVEKLLGRLIGEDVELVTKLAAECLIVMADEGQIEQVLMNLVTNARDAMPRGGTITLSTEMVDLGEDFVAAHGYGRPGKCALIILSDTGIGMDEATRKRIFEPFFTTKGPGKGTGLGLSMAYGIVKQHDGTINVYSEPGRGTTFRIYLPLIALAVGETRADKVVMPPRGTETLLLAEDDPDVRTLAGTILRDFGYRVVEAVDGKEAIEQFQAHRRDIDLLILDVIMPKMSGKEAYDAITAIHPGVKTLFISGYTADYLHKKGVFEEGVQFVTKPMSPFDLLKKIRVILDGKA